MPGARRTAPRSGEFRTAAGAVRGEPAELEGPPLRHGSRVTTPRTVRWNPTVVPRDTKVWLTIELSL